MSDLVTLFRQLDYGPAPESDQPAQAWLDQHQRSFALYLNGNWQPSSAGEPFQTINPATGEELAVCAQAGPEDVLSAIAGARQAQPAWEQLGGHQRARFLYALARELQQHARLLAVLETMDNGKPLRETRDIDLPLVIRHFYHHAGWAQLLSEELPQHQAVGVIGQIIPWNFPLLMLAWKVAPALACGNTVVLKPAEQTPLTALWFAECCQRVGLPPGVFQLLTGDGQVGQVLVEQSSKLDKIAFTGSTAVGKQIREKTAESTCRLSLELGGKSPFLVFEDADLDSAVEGVVDAIWLNQGEVCCAGSRLLLQESIAERFLQKLRIRMQQLRVGNPLDKSIDLGSLVSPEQQARVEQLLQAGERSGAQLWQPKTALPTEGCFLRPTLVTNAEPSNVLAQEEIFGPVVVALTFRTPAEALELANNTPYGLAASLWSENLNQALDLVPSLQAGVIWVNSTNQFDASCGFGGYRESGFGREGGREGLLEYLKPRTPMWSDRPIQRHSVVAEEEDLLNSATIHRTTKFYIGGKQVRPDGGTVRSVWNRDGSLAGTVGVGNRKDLRNAVEAALKAHSWGKTSGHLRAQILYYLAENLNLREAEFCKRLQQLVGYTKEEAQQEFTVSLQRCFHYAAWADKFEGTLHQPPQGMLTPVLQEPQGVMGLICPDECPLLASLSLLLPALATGNRVLLIPSFAHALVAADLIQVLETSDIPAGVVNVIHGEPIGMVETLARHEEVQGLWVFGTQAEVSLAKRLSVSNLKRIWSSEGQTVDWHSPQSQGRSWLENATQIKNVWIPFGES